MELKDYIREALVQVVSGVEEAREELKGKGVLINPLVDKNGGVVSSEGSGQGQGRRQSQELEFNIAITTESKEGAKGGLGVISGIFSAGASKSTESGDTAYNSLKFSIPFALAGDKKS